MLCPKRTIKKGQRLNESEKENRVPVKTTQRPSDKVFVAISEETTRIQQGKPLAKLFVAEPIGQNLFCLREEVSNRQPVCESPVKLDRE